MYRCRPWPAATGLIRACSGGGGGLSDHACQQRCSAIQGESQARTARGARGQGGAGGGTAARGPALSAAMFWPRWRRILLRRGIGEPGGPAEGEGAVDQGLVAADREVRADLEIGPAQLVVESAWGAVPGLPRVRFPRPLAEPAVRLSTQRALRGSCC